jgi:uncharacterized YigZ family protein
VVTIEQHYEVTTEVNRSKFIAHLMPMLAVDGAQERLKRAHPKASHVVYAYRHLNAHDQIVENSSDDGEPHGAAGIPILNVLRGKGAIECAVMVVRYFGGTKLGIGGMVRAYTLAAQNVIAQAEWMPHLKQIAHAFVTSYSQIQRTEYRLQQLGIVQVDRQFGIGEVTWEITATQEQIDAFEGL